MPQELSVSGAHGLGLDEAKINIYLDAFLDDLFIDLVSGPVSLDLLNYGFGDGASIGFEYALNEE